MVWPGRVICEVKCQENYVKTKGWRVGGGGGGGLYSLDLHSGYSGGRK